MAAKDEAIAAAKQLEVDGRAFYIQAAGKATSEQAEKLFESLAADEARHLEWLEGLAPGVKTSREANVSLYARLKDVFAEAPDDVRQAIGGAEGDMEAIEFAIGAEDRTIQVYSEWAQSAEAGDLLRLGEVLVGQERFHRQLLENAKEYLERPGDWFMQEERWNFEGG